MKRHVLLLGLVASMLVTMASISDASIRLNSSRSGVYRVASDPDLVSPTQASVILDELDKAFPNGTAPEAAVRRILQAQLGDKYPSVQGLMIEPAAGPGKPASIYVLKTKADLTAAKRLVLQNEMPGVARQTSGSAGMQAGFPAPSGTGFPAPPAQPSGIAVSDPGAPSDKPSGKPTK